jgi:hypothetical protein
MCPRCGQAIAGADVDLASQMALCRPCGEIVPLGTTLAGEPSMAIVAAASAGPLYRPTDMSWREERGGETSPDAWRVTVVPSRLAAVPLAVFALFWVGLLVCWLPLLLEPPPAVVLLFPLAHLALAARATFLALCALVNRTTVTVDRDRFAFARGPIRQMGDVTEPTMNIVGFEAVPTIVRSNATAARLRWGIHLLTRDGRAIPLRFGFADASHAKYAAARLTQILVDARRALLPYRG